ncbi:MAG: translation elongation factor Ts [Candidatus Dormibacter sp.]|uniref:translation elongation factor Ts n=1 Tax=Candidatus Dormibacter sp. TaxID=2973982 RepID=UPI000DB24341|nr:MAG: translation elongation factor Ts [Candidatus Dormibacteraeota bacterium]
MIDISLERVKQLRDMTGAGMMDCKKALEDAQGDLDRAVVILRERGIAKAAKRADRVTSNGVVEAYLHRTSEDYPPQIGALIELNCESDFVAKGTDFRTLARELAMHVAAAAPRWVSRDEVPSELVEQERTLYQLRAEQDGKPAQAIPKIVAGQLEAFYKDSCLLDQPYMRDPATPVRELVASAVAKLQENITVRRFQRFSIKEG